MLLTQWLIYSLFQLNKAVYFPRDFTTQKLCRALELSPSTPVVLGYGCGFVQYSCRVIKMAEGPGNADLGSRPCGYGMHDCTTGCGSSFD